MDLNSKWKAFRSWATAIRSRNAKSEDRLISARRPRGRQLTVLLIAAALIAVVGGFSFDATAQAQQQIQIGATNRTATVTVYIAKTQDVRTDTSFVDITVGNPDVADVNPLTDKTLSILGKKNGTTRVSVYAEGKKLIGVFDVEVVYDTTMLQTELKRRFPGAKLKVSAVNGRIMISGTAPDGPTVDQAMQIAKQFGPGVINSIEVQQPQQVMLEVRFIEVTRSAGRELGVNWYSFGKKHFAKSGLVGAHAADDKDKGESTTSLSGSAFLSMLPSGATPYGTLLAKLIKSGLEIDAIIMALEQQGVARSLAEPNLVALSGDTANFLAGGEFPFPVPGGPTGQLTIEWKRFGVGLAFTPTVLSNGLINLKVVPEVSQLDFSTAVLVGNIRVPGLSVRRASTTVELKDGQSFAIGGLLQNVGQNDLSQLPWLGDVPVLGALFRSTQYQKKETDLAIVITPRLVRPARPGDVIRTPADSTLPANDTDLFLMGKTEVTPAQAQLIADIPPRGYTGHMLDLMQGHTLDLSKGGAHVVSVRN